MSYRTLLAALLALATLPGTTMAQAQKTLPDSQAQIQLSYAPLVKQTAPAVVNIFAQKRPQQVNSPLMNDPVLRRFFGEQLQQRSRPSFSLGSGVIVREDGYVVTNAHVVGDADDINVVLSDRREFEAKVVLKDDRSDLALLKVEAKGLPSLVLADSEKVETGDIVLAIGNPFGVGQTVTSGIVSAAARSAAGIGDFGFFIQTDAAINPGNSGGALLSMDGRLLGINTAIYSQSGGSIGIGFAIPSNIVRTVIDAGERGDKQIVRPFLGVSSQPMTNELAQSLGLSRPTGVLVDQVTKGGAADRAGLKPGDVIVAIDGKEVLDPGSLRYRLQLLKVDSTAEMTVLRKGAEQKLAFTVAAEALPQDETVIPGQGPLAGQKVATLTPALADQKSLSVKEGVLITDVASGSAAEQVGLEKDDIILRLNNQPVTNVKQLQQALRARGVALQVRRGDRVFNAVIG